MATTDRKTSSRGAPSPRKTPSGDKSSSSSRDAAGGERRAPRTRNRPSASAGRVAQLARQQFLDLSGKDPEAVTGLERTEDGWTVLVEVVELRRVPSTTDVLAIYEVDVDPGGDLRGYRRLSRFVRGAAEDR